MPSHYSTLGFQFDTADELVAVAEKLAPDCGQVVTSRGRYLVWSSPSGAQLWLQVNKRNELVGAQPHFAGTSVLNVRASGRIRRQTDTELDGSFHVWLRPESGASYDEYPFVFDCVNYREFSSLPLPALGSVQVAAFAHEIDAFESAAAFDASQTTEYKFAPESFVPSGSFVEEGPAESTAIFSGEVLAAERRQNELTGGSFIYCSVRTLGADLDVVVDSSLIDDVPRVGHIVSGSFWLSGHVLQLRSEAKLASRIWQRLTAG